MAELDRIAGLMVAAALLPLLCLRPLSAAIRRVASALGTEDREALSSGGALLFSFVAILALLAHLIPGQDGRLIALLLLAYISGAAIQVLRSPSHYSLLISVSLLIASFALGHHFDLSAQVAPDSGALGLLVDFAVTSIFLLGLFLSIHLMDRLKGLATGVTLIIALTLVGLVVRWSMASALVLLLVASICLGHLLLNQWHQRRHLGLPAQFMLAALLGAVTIDSRTWGPTLGILFVPLLALLAPMFDSVYTILHRLRFGPGSSGRRPVSLLLDLGLTERWIVFAIWIATLQVGVLVNFVYTMESLMLGAVGGASLLAAYGFALLFLHRAGDRIERRRNPGGLRILFLSHYFHPEVNAPASRLYEHGRRWTAQGHQVTILTTIPSAPHGWPYRGYHNGLWLEEEVDGMRVIRLWTFVAANRGRLRRSLNYLSYMASSLMALLLVGRHDVMVATTPQFFCGLAGAVGSLFRREAFVLEVRDIWPDSIVAVGAGRPGLVYRTLQRLAHWMYMRSAAVVTVGNGYRDKLLETPGLSPHRIHVIPNGIDTDVFASGHPPPAGRPLLAALGVSPDRLVIVYAGTIGMAHGLEVVLEAAHRLGRDARVTFVLAGDGAERERLAAMAARLRLTNVVFAGLVAKRDMPLLLAECDACLVHLRPDPLFQTVLPSKLFEAFGAGRPVLLGLKGEALALLQEADAGIAFEPGDPQALLGAVERLGRMNRASRDAMGSRGSEFVRRRHTRDRLAAVYTQVLATVMAAQMGDAGSGALPASVEDNLPVSGPEAEAADLTAASPHHPASSPPAGP